MASTAFRSDPRAARIAHSLQQVEISDLAIWGELDALSNRTRVEGVEVPEEGVVLGANNRFSAILNLYLSLEYGKGEDGFTTSESLLARVEGYLIGDNPVVENATVDTSDFSTSLT